MDLSVVIPVYNSEKIIEDLVKKINFSLTNIQFVNSYEIIIINDCSPDNCWEKIKYLANKFSFVKGISLAENFGQHNAIMAGLNEAKGESIITMDDDLQHSPDSIKNLLAELDKGYEVCYVRYLNRKHKSWKIVVSWANNMVQSYLLNKPYDIYMSSFRALKKKIAKEIINYHGPYTFVDGLILNKTRNISIIPVQHNKRPLGESNYSFTKLWSLWANISSTFPFLPFRFATILRVILFIIIVTIRGIFTLFKRSKKLQYVICETTFDSK